MGTTWFETLFGFPETSYTETQGNFALHGTRLHSRANGREFDVGTFTTPSLEQLRVATKGMRAGQLRVNHDVVGDVLELHAVAANTGALFQVASQFNCLEFPGPNTTPELGITGYANDPTQGPACALAAAAATVYRNYLVPVQGAAGQAHDRQLDNLDALAARMGASGRLFEVRNGYTQSNVAKLTALGTAIGSHPRDELLGAVKIGLQQGVEVTFRDRFTAPQAPCVVSQAFCSAVSCSYSNLPLQHWKPLATLALDAAYEGTLLAAVLDAATANGSGRVWLTFLGGGAFGNPRNWIASAISRALHCCRHFELEVRVAHFKRIDVEMRDMIELAMASTAGS